MKIENLYAGQVFKNYKALCAELEMEIKSNTNSKNSQYKELERYCSYVKDGHKITVKEVYETPKEKVDGRGKSEGCRRSIYGNAAQLLITDILAQSNGYITISKNKLMVSIGMTNVNYGECSQQVKKLEKLVDIDKSFIYEFYNINNSNFSNIIQSALENLQDKSIIMYNNIIKVREQGRFNTRKATKWEVYQILECERETLEELGFEEKSKIRVSNKWMEFKKEVQNKLNKRTEIHHYFPAYEITVNEKYIEQERNKLADLLLEQVVKDETLNQLNSTIIDHFINNSQLRKEQWFTAGNKSKSELRNNSKYIENMKELATLLIDRSAKSILNELRSTKEEDDLIFEDLFG
ncbi:hypothetical protein ABC255_08645 [Neobacillus sp. 3P2-tot-E-2]|uniref:hypothetical protein n=1 Tax=Neobacillus sp. 3P2-tot-E-2 TaxID=3132212 RepID=UPI0039A10531